MHYEVRKHQGELKTSKEVRFCILIVEGSKVLQRLPETYDTRGDAKRAMAALPPLTN